MTAKPGTVPFVLVGDLMMDITAVTNEPINYASDTRAQISIQPGGGAATTAAWLAHLGEDVHLIGALGDDLFATMFREALTGLGVHLHASKIRGTATGTCIVLVDATGERTMLPDPGPIRPSTSTNSPIRCSPPEPICIFPGTPCSTRLPEALVKLH